MENQPSYAAKLYNLEVLTEVCSSIEYMSHFIHCYVKVICFSGKIFSYLNLMLCSDILSIKSKDRNVLYER